MAVRIGNDSGKTGETGEVRAARLGLPQPRPDSSNSSNPALAEGFRNEAYGLELRAEVIVMNNPHERAGLLLQAGRKLVVAVLEDGGLPDKGNLALAERAVADLAEAVKGFAKCGEGERVDEAIAELHNAARLQTALQKGKRVTYDAYMAYGTHPVQDSPVQDNP